MLSRGDKRPLEFSSKINQFRKVRSMKRLFSICLIACLLTMPLGCGDKKDDAEKSDTNTSTDTGDDKEDDGSGDK